VTSDRLDASTLASSFDLHTLEVRLDLQENVKSNGFTDRCTEETAYSAGTESVARALEVFVNQYDWLPGPLTFRVVKRLKFSAVGIVGITLG
jgi:hypothetical protein